MQNLPAEVKIVEVGPRDGLQNEAAAVPTETKLAFIRVLVAAGLRQIEATSFVNPKAIPQLADAVDVARQLSPAPGVVYSALVPNEKGLERAIEAGIRRIAVFTAASETFTQKNINMTIAQSLEIFGGVIRKATAAGMSVRGYLLTCFVCPFEGAVSRDAVLDVTQRLLDLGVDEVAISDTVGAATPDDVFETVGHVVRSAPREKIALHFHDTFGTALANVMAGLELGITTFDGSAGGLGGCPYSPGASGNLATEDLVYALEKMGVATGIDLKKLASASAIIEAALGRPLPGRVYRAITSKKRVRQVS